MAIQHIRIDELEENLRELPLAMHAMCSHSSAADPDACLLTSSGYNSTPIPLMRVHMYLIADPQSGSRRWSCRPRSSVLLTRSVSAIRFHCSTTVKHVHPISVYEILYMYSVRLSAKKLHRDRCPTKASSRESFYTVPLRLLLSEHEKAPAFGV